MDKKALMIPAPEFAVRLAMGEMADVIFTSTNVSSKKIESTGFDFNYPDLIPALENLLESEH